MPVKRDYYEILGIDIHANNEEIKRAFRRLAFQYHPDRNHEDDATTKFKEVNEAYEVLSDPNKRAAYDRFGHSGAEGFLGKGFEGFNFGGFGDIFEAFFGGASTATRQAPQRGADLRSSVTISLEEAAFGCENEITISHLEHCSLCQGIGAKPGSQPSQCPECDGAGQVRRVQTSIFGRFISTTTCSRCRGEGRIITDPCPQCRGTGTEKRQRGIRVRIPPGVDDGSRIRISSQGSVGPKGGSPGDLYITISVEEHEFFTRDGDNIIYELPVNLAQAALGTEVEVPTLEGKTKLNIPAGSQTGRVFQLKNKGITHLHRNGRGDQLVTLFVVTPEKLTEKQQQLLQELANSLNDSNMPQTDKWKSWLDRLKTSFGV
ncbi:molecular chaperone DnaJ [Chloroflexota bacterium]